MSRATWSGPAPTRSRARARCSPRSTRPAGPSTNGSFRRVEIRRGGTLVDSLDVYEYLLRGINPTDVRLQTGDVVFVPVHGALAKVAGKVIRPAIYELKPAGVAARSHRVRRWVRSAGLPGDG